MLGHLQHDSKGTSSKVACKATHHSRKHAHLGEKFKFCRATTEQSSTKFDNRPDRCTGMLPYLEKVKERKKGEANKDRNATEGYDTLQHSVVDNFRHLLRALLSAGPFWELLLRLLMLLLRLTLTCIWSGDWCSTFADLETGT